jgi:hypothetical protein
LESETSHHAELMTQQQVQIEVCGSLCIQT